MEAAGHGSEGAIKYRRNGVGPGSNVQGGGTFGAIIWQQKLGGDWVDAQGPGRVTPSDGTTDHRGDGKMRGRWRVVVPLGSGGNVSLGVSPHWVVDQEAVGDHIVEGGIPPCL